VLVPIKWPAAFLVSGYLLFASCITADRRARALTASLAGTVVGAILFVVTTSDLGIGNIFIFNKFFGVFFVPEYLGSHAEISTLFERYADSVVFRFIELMRYPAAVGIVLLPVGTMVVSALSRGRAGWRLLLRALVVATLAALAAFAIQAAPWAWNHLHWFHRLQIADLHTFAFVAAWIGACCCVYPMRNVIPHRYLAAFIGATALLGMLPVIGSAGTDNPLLDPIHSPHLFAALAITASFLGFAGGWRPFPRSCARLWPS
jgi:hypothetical protein